MKVLRRFFLRLFGVFGDSTRSRDFSRELDSHLEMATADYLRAGLTPEKARRRAIHDLGGMESTRQSYREALTLPGLETFLGDLGFAARQLRRNATFAVTAVLMLALGTCAATSIFAFVDSALLKPLPYAEPSRLMGVFESIALGPHYNLSYPDYLDWKRENSAFTSLDVYQRTGFVLSTSGGLKPVRGARLSDGFFSTLGVRPLLGRAFLPGEDLPSAPRTTLLSFGTWQQRYGSRPDIVGQIVMLNREPNVIIGVLPRDFQFAPVGSPEFFTTIHANGSCDLRRSCHDLLGIGRLKPGLTPAAAAANLIGIAARLEKLYPKDNRGQSASLLPLSDYILGDIRPVLYLLLAGAALLLSIACVNIASLLLVRTQSRQREIAVRTALGASRARMLRQFVTEALLLVGLGTVLGAALSAGAIRLLLRLIPNQLLAGMPYLNDMGFSIHTFLFTGLIALSGLVIFSLIPVLRLPRARFTASLSEGGRGSVGTTWKRLGANLVILELAMALVLLIGAGLLGKSLYRLLHIDLGFVPDHLVVLSVAAPESRYGKDPEMAALASRLLDSASSLPGVTSAALSSGLPIGGAGGTEWIRILGRPWHGEHLEMLYLEISPAYFSTLGAHLARGRLFNTDDNLSHPRVAIINRSFARAHFPGEDPVGHQLLHTSVATDKPMLIVGVVEDVQEDSLTAASAPVLYLPFAQSTETYASMIVRTNEADSVTLPALMRAVHEIDPDLVLDSPGNMNDRIANSSEAYIHRSVAVLVGAFAVTALLLGIVGLYGVVAYSVSQRTREIGVRMALGAQRTSIYALILREAGVLIVAGIVVGAACSLATASLLQKLLYGIHGYDYLTLALVSTLLALAALLASYFPARRAASINPTQALRAE